MIGSRVARRGVARRGGVRRDVVVGSLVFFLLAGIAGVGQARPDPAGVIGQFEAALNAGNIDACMAWIAKDGVIRENLGKEVKGHDQIRDYLTGLAAHGYRAIAGDRKVAGTTVTWLAKVAFDDLRALGVDSVDGRGKAVVVNGKMKSYTPAFSPGSMFILSMASARATEMLVRTIVDEVYNKGNIEAVDQYYTEGFINHDAFPGTRWDRDGIKTEVGKLRAAFAKFKVTVDEVASTGEFATIRTTWTGRHEGEYLGRPATYRDIEISGIELLRITDGKVVERWAQQDDYDLGLITGRIETVGEPGKKKKRKKAGSSRNRKGFRKGSGGILGWFFDLF